MGLSLESNELLRKILFGLAEIVDNSLMPQTTVSSIGMDIAYQLQSLMNPTINSRDDKVRPVLFAKGLATILAKTDFAIVLESAQENHIRFSVTDCIFSSKNTFSLCAIMQGIIGGLAYLYFGYSKVSVTCNPKKSSKVCYIDLYIKQTPEIESIAGVEYTKHSVSIIKADNVNEKVVASQRQLRRKFILGLFSNLTLSLRESSSINILAEKFIATLSNIPEVRLAALYLRDLRNGHLNLEAQYGIPEDMIPLIKTIDTVSIDKDKFNTNALTRAEDFNGYRLILGKKLAIRSFASAKIKTKYHIVGVLNIGWKSTLPISPEMREALQASCIMLGLVIEDLMVYSELESAYQSNLAMLNNLVNYVDHFSANHSKQVASLAKAIAAEMGLPPEEQEIIYRAGLFHDIGKIQIPPDVLNKAEKLTDEEYEMIKNHPVVGAKMLAPITAYLDIVPAILCHHERLDGSGYPGGLTQEDIPMRARIIAIADAYSAMTSTRSYRKAIDKYEALQEIKQGSGIKYDAAVVDALVALISKRGIKPHEDEGTHLFEHSYLVK